MPVTEECRLLQDDPQSIAAVIFTGGEDVNPSLYDVECDPSTEFNVRRDLLEVSVYDLALENNIPMVGICRGAQLLCVLSGGKLVQDINNHERSHLVEALWPGKNVITTMKVSSSHHQMQLLTPLLEEEYSILAWSKDPLSTYYTFSPGSTVPVGEIKHDSIRKEPDVVWYKSTNCLAVQYHPEWMHPDSLGFKYFSHLFDYYILGSQANNSDDGTREKTSQTTS